MRGIVVGSVISVVLWTLLAWGGVCAWTCLESTVFSVSALALVSSLACILGAGIVSLTWVACLGEDVGPDTSVGPNLMTSD